MTRLTSEWCSSTWCTSAPTWANPAPHCGHRSPSPFSSPPPPSVRAAAPVPLFRRLLSAEACTQYRRMARSRCCGRHVEYAHRVWAKLVSNGKHPSRKGYGTARQCKTGERLYTTCCSRANGQHGSLTQKKKKKRQKSNRSIKPVCSYS